MGTTAPFYSRKRRWSDNDQHFGIFTYSWNTSYKRIEVMLCSGGEEDEGCHLRLSPWWFTLIIELPAIVPPYKEKIVADWDSETVQRLGRDYYYDISEREYGFSLSADQCEGFLQVRYGRQTHDSLTNQVWCYFLPFTQWRFVRRSCYGLNGEHFYTEPQGLRWFTPEYNASAKQFEECPSVTFRFKDFDGEELTARTVIQEMEWHFGTGWFKWLSWFRRPRIRRWLDLKFSGETGERKGSWKGGAVGHSIDTNSPRELHESAFMRYCAGHRMTYLGEVGEDEEA